MAVWDTALSAATIAEHAGIDYAPASGATAVNTTALTLTNISAYNSFTETATKPASTNIKYQLSNDNATWKWWNGTAWAAASLATDYTDAATINTNIGTLFAALPGSTLYVKAQLNTSINPSDVRPELDNVNVGYTTTVPATYNTSGTYTSGVMNTGQKSDFTTASWTAAITNTDNTTQAVNYNTAGDYTYDNAKVEFSGTAARLKKSNRAGGNHPNGQHRRPVAFEWKGRDDGTPDQIQRVRITGTLGNNSLVKVDSADAIRCDQMDMVNPSAQTTTNTAIQAGLNLSTATNPSSSWNIGRALIRQQP